MVPVGMSFSEELNVVQARVNRDIKLKAAKFNELVDISLDEMDRYACPSIVLAVSKACGYVGEKSLALAAIIEFIHMANEVHRLMRDHEISEHNRQFPVLVGDYLFGKFFLELCREQLLKYLAPLAQGIVQMSEGAILRWKNCSQDLKDKEIKTEEWLFILEEELGSLTGLSARLGADLAGASDSLQDKLEELGSQLGLAWAARRQNLDNSVIYGILQKAKNILRELPNSLQIQPLRELYDFVDRNVIQTVEP